MCKVQNKIDSLVRLEDKCWAKALIDVSRTEYWAAKAQLLHKQSARLKKLHADAINANDDLSQFAE